MANSPVSGLTMPVSSVWTAERSQATTSSRSRRRRSKRAINGTRANRATSPKAIRVRPIWAGSTANMATRAMGLNNAEPMMTPREVSTVAPVR